MAAFVVIDRMMSL